MTMKLSAALVLKIYFSALWRALVMGFGLGVVWCIIGMCAGVELDQIKSTARTIGYVFSIPIQVLALYWALNAQLGEIAQLVRRMEVPPVLDATDSNV